MGGTLSLSGQAIRKSQRSVRVSQMIEYLPSKCEALSSNTSTVKNKRRRKKCQTGALKEINGFQMDLEPFPVILSLKDKGDWENQERSG
jgi:hypothetical protein